MKASPLLLVLALGTYALTQGLVLAESRPAPQVQQVVQAQSVPTPPEETQGTEAP